MLRTTSIAILALVIVFTGCKKKEQCAAGDTPEVETLSVSHKEIRL